MPALSTRFWRMDTALHLTSITQEIIDLIPCILPCSGLATQSGRAAAILTPFITSNPEPVNRLILILILSCILPFLHYQPGIRGKPIYSHPVTEQGKHSCHWIDPFHLNRACAMDWCMRFAESRGEHVSWVAGRAHSCIALQRQDGWKRLLPGNHWSNKSQEFCGTSVYITEHFCNQYYSV